MNREIKYRGKVKMPEKRNFARQEYVPEGQWVYGEPHTIDCPTPHIHTVDVGKQPIDEDTIGQFTGLKDRNGKEIYEGDILTWRSIICEEDPVETWELPVTFYNGCFCLNDDFDMTLISVIYDSEEFGGVKIIGNIHDNPELMEGDK